jgi:DNA-binding protein YbaB
MFDNLKGMASLPGLMAKAGEMKSRMADVREKIAKELGALRSEADAGGGMVTAVCNGRMELVRVKIDPERLKLDQAGAEDLELLEDLIVAAVAAAQEKAQGEAAEVTRREMDKVADELGLPPGLMDQLKAAEG